MASPSGSDDTDDGRLFEGVRFVLVGFDDANASQYRSDMVARGGVDAGRLSNGCTHVVVWGLLYDDPECELARAHGKKVVSELWVDDSLDRGVLADPDRALYWPVREFNGISGAESLVICLTGFQKKYREDITKMVSLMGAQFSKPLVGNVVSHLICYKFEGDKYELAKKVHIKVTNHRWLEDCLKTWKLLPVEDYSKSTWELELMEAQVKDSEDEAEDTGQMSLDFRSRVRCTPNLRNGAETSVNPDAKAPMQSPIIPNGNREFAVERYLNTPGHSRKTIDADIEKADVSAPVETPSALSVKRKNAAVRNTNSPNMFVEFEEKYIGARTRDNTSDATGTPNWSGNELDSSDADRGQHQEEDASSGNLVAVAAVVQSNIDNKLIYEKANQNSEGGSMSNNLSNSKKTPQKSSAAERRSVHHMASQHKTDESMLRADTSNSSLEIEQQKGVEHADIQGMKSNETNRIDRVNVAYAQQRDDLNSPASSKLQKGDLVSETSPLYCPSVNRLSKSVDISPVGTNLTEDISIDLGKQQSSLSTSRQSRTRKSALKHAGLVNEGKVAEYSSCVKSVKSLSKSRSLLKAMKKNKSTMSSSATVQDGKANSGFSFESKDRKNAEARASAVNQDRLHLMHETGSAHTKDDDTSEHCSRNSQVVSCSGISDTMITAPDGSVNEVAAVTIIVSSAPNVKEDAKGFQDASSDVQGETSHSKKIAIPTERTACAKRLRSSCTDIDGSVVNTDNKKLVPESQPAEVVPQNNDNASSKNGYSTASAAELKAVTPKKKPISRVRNTVTRRTRNALTKVDDAQVAPNLEGIPQENTGLNPTKVSDIANSGEHKSNPPKKLPNTRVRNVTARKSEKSVTNLSSEALVDKTETMAAGALFDDMFSEDNVQDVQKMLSSSASASNCGTLSPKDVSTPKVRNAVAKRKMKDVEHKVESKCGKVGRAIASVAKAVSLKRIGEISGVTAEQNFEKDNKNVSGLFCQDSATVDKPGVRNSNLRGSKRNKVRATDHGKENKQNHSDLNSMSNTRTGGLCSISDAKSMMKGTDVLGKRQNIKENESRTSIMIEPVLFILSGDRQQRADYRSILRRLKGRVCRDSHHWSYQATHFIVPEPLRRTEKFFAAAAAGRWILKSDYLTSCFEAGKFLDEEPFEWFGTGLSDGQKISLEAPRKWRILRQQMHHGAFYGMQIFVYGQLVLPTLDTVKRAVQAGDGTILATSPPYTRFLESGVDFAVVSASIPSADAWIQEFIRHGIPCINADYLVEYVCKPGHPLESHVLFETNDLANKSLEKLMKNQQEVATDESEQSVDEDDGDLSCSVCGHKDRGDVMLICGDEDGKAGCGIGMHIDCCDPPLDAVPDDDWLCPKCSVQKTKTKPTRSTARKLRPSKEM